MSVISSITIADNHVQTDGRRYVRHVFTDHLNNELSPSELLVDGAWTETEYAIDRVARIPKVENSLAELEIKAALRKAAQDINPDAVPDHQAQNVFDRRVLYRAMLVKDAHMFYSMHQMFQAIESRGGANGGQRAAYLEITADEYTLIATRFGNVSGVSWFLTDEKNQIWSDLPENY